MSGTNDSVCRFRFEALRGFFFDYAEQARLDPGFRARTLPSLGLLDRKYPTDDPTTSANVQKSWARFNTYVENLNQEAAGTAHYKVLFITRHGLGVHNKFEAEVGREAWNNHWSFLSGNGEITWEDAHLVDEGIQQAQLLGQTYAKAWAEDQMPVPKAIYTSPLARCLETTKLVFEPGMKRQGVTFYPTVKELLRERLTDHLCDKRSTKSWITEHYPDYALESGITEEDELWTGKRWETSEEHVARKQRVFEDIFENDGNPFIALTTHSYAISAILEVVGLDFFRVREGSSIAILVKAEKVTSN